VTDSHAERRAAVLIGCLLLPLVLLTILVVAEFEPLMSFDAWLTEELWSSIQGTGWVGVFDAVADVSQPMLVRVLMFVVALVLLLRGHRREALWVAVVAAITGPLWWSLKQIVGRDRPEIANQIDGFTYPSGHASEIAAAMGVFIVLTIRHVRRQRWRRLLIVLWVTIAVLVGIDRQLTGAHFPSDTVAGWLFGSLVVLVSGLAFGLIRVVPVMAEERPLSTMPENLRTLGIVLNPIKVDDPEAFKTRVGLAARAAGWDEPLWFETTVDDAGASMARAAVAAGADVVVAAGGDGTVRVVCSEMAGTGIPVGVIPVGTGNLLARNLSIPLSHDAALDAVLRGQDRAIDIVRIEGDDMSTTRFVVMAGLGLDAAIMEGAPDALKAKIGWSAYVVAGARQLRYPAIRVDISMDGGEPMRRRARTVVIGNVGSLQAGIPLLPDAKIDDGVLDVVVIAPRRLFGWVPLLIRVLTRRKRVDEKLDRYTGRSVTIETQHATPRQLDGDTVGPGTRIHAEIEPGRLLMRVPR
jgi:diacylglycerol kinase family enzyme/membrane-associated phospholipid phosphatase